MESFHDAFARLASQAPRHSDTYLSGLSDNVDIAFTHGDLDQSNILISKAIDGPARIVALIDWHQSGWYPKPWERLKAEYVTFPDSDWVKFLPLRPVNKAYYRAWEYVNMSILTG